MVKRGSSAKGAATPGGSAAKKQKGKASGSSTPAAANGRGQQHDAAAAAAGAGSNSQEVPTDRPVRVYADGEGAWRHDVCIPCYACIVCGAIYTQVGPSRGKQLTTKKHHALAVSSITPSLFFGTGIFDMFHFGHARALEQAKKL